MVTTEPRSDKPGIGRLSIVVVSNCSPGSRYFLRQLLAVFPVRKILKPVWRDEPDKEPATRPKPLIRRLWDKLNDLYRVGVSRRLGTALSREFGDIGLTLPQELLIEVPVAELNSEHTAATLAELAPDLLITCGSPILGERLLAIPRRGAINVHFGIAPPYRGEHTILWPLMRLDFRRIGVTIHRMTSRVDAGPVLMRGYPRIEPQDYELRLLIKCHRLASRLMLELLTYAIEQGLPTGKQFSLEESCLIRYRDRTILSALRGLAARIYPRPRLPERIERLYL